MPPGIKTRRRTIRPAATAGLTLAAEMLADSPAVFLKLDEVSGSTANDSSGNARHVALGSSPTWGAALVGGGGAVITTQNGSLADAAWMESTTITVEAWIKTTAAAYSILLDRRTVNETFSFQFRGDTTGYLEGLSASNPASAPDTTAGPTTVVNNNARHQIVMRVNTPNRVVDIILDGSNKTGNTPAGTTLATTGTSPLSFFKQGASRQFTGTIAYVAYYTTALSDARIAAHYAAA